MSGFEERKLRLQFYPHELESLKCIVLRHRVLENGTHDMTTERLQNGTWQSITEEFNAQNDNRKRTTNQLQCLWKRLKRECNTFPSSVKNQELENGCWPQSLSQDTVSPEEFTDLGILLNEQAPAESIPTEYDNVIDVGDIQDIWEIENPTTQTPTYPASTFEPDAWSTTSTEPVTNHNFGINKLTTKVQAFEEDFHATRMAYLKEEHALKMKVFEEELRYWQRMNCSAPQYAEPQSPLEQTIGQETYQLLSGATHRF